jgi:tetratricopeptide (TPR) repeat protein/predicted Ser/Thr protein kinase
VNVTCPGCGTAYEGERCPACGKTPEAAAVTVALPPPSGSDPTVVQGANRAPATAPKKIGRYDILATAGAGGMGIVYRARDTALGRVVALKVMIAGEHASRETLARFDREARAAARLDHPGIVRVYDVGAEGSAHFIAMEYVEGRALDRAIRDAGVAPREAARMVRDVARALAAAHAVGIVHRDIKPANVLVDSAGAARLTDFGLAKTGDADGGLTRTDQVMGTACYMPPEQVSGMKDVDGQSDVYSLGAVLYEALTRRRPFEGETMAAILRDVEDKDPPPPSRVTTSVPRDLETICMTAMAKRKSKRYASMAAMADDLDRFLDGAPIAARREGTLSRGWRWAKRRPALSGTAAVALVLAGALAWQLTRPRPGTRDTMPLLKEASPHFSAGIADYEAARRVRNREGRAVRQTKLRSAAEHFDRAIAVFPDHADALHARARVLRELNRIPQALADLDRALELNPAQGDARYDRIMVRLRDVQTRAQRGTFVLRPEDFAQAFAAEKTKLDADIEALRRLGILESRRLTAEAYTAYVFDVQYDPLPLLEKAIAQDPTFADAYLARALYRLGGNPTHPDISLRKYLASAEADASAAIDQEPNLRDAWMARAQVRLRMGREGDAFADLDEAVSIAPDEPRSRLDRLMVVFFSSVGTARHRARMRADVEGVLARDAGNPLALLVRTALEYQDLILGRPARPAEESRAALAALLKSDPDLAATWYLAMAFDLAVGDKDAFAQHEQGAAAQFAALPEDRARGLVGMARTVDLTRMYAAVTPGLRDELARGLFASDEGRWADAETAYREVLRRLGDKADTEAAKLIPQARQLYNQMSTLRLVGALAGQGKKDEALAALGKALQSGIGRDGAWIGDAEMTPLRGEAKWDELVGRYAPK